MIVLLRAGASRADEEALLARIRELGLTAVPLDGPKGRGLELLGTGLGQALELRDAPAVQEILTRRTALTGGEPLWPHFALRLGIASILCVTGLCLLAAWLPPGLGDAASAGGDAAAAAAEGATVEWFMRPAAGLLGLMPGAARPVMSLAGLLAWGLLFFWPWIDRSRRCTPGRRRALRLLGLAALLALVALGAVA